LECYNTRAQIPSLADQLDQCQRERDEARQDTATMLAVKNDWEDELLGVYSVLERDPDVGYKGAADAVKAALDEARQERDRAVAQIHRWYREGVEMASCGASAPTSEEQQQPEGKWRARGFQWFAANLDRQALRQRAEQAEGLAHQVQDLATQLEQAEFQRDEYRAGTAACQEAGRAVQALRAQAEAERDAARMVFRDTADRLMEAQAQIIPVADREQAVLEAATAAEEGDGLANEIAQHVAEPWRWAYPNTYLSDGFAYACAVSAAHHARQSRRLLKLPEEG
jgi:hypothetical protein